MNNQYLEIIYNKYTVTLPYTEIGKARVFYYDGIRMIQNEALYIPIENPNDPIESLDFNTE